MENIDTVSRKKNTAYFTHFRRSCHFCGSWVWKRLRPMALAILKIASCSEPNGHIQPQNRPRPNRNTVTMMKIQNRKMNGSDRNSDQVHWNRMEWNQVSTCVMEGWAMVPKPIQKMLRAQNVYLKPLTGHLFLCVDRRVSFSRSAYTTVTATSSRANRPMGSACDFQMRTQGASGSWTSGRPPSSRAAGSQYLASNTAKLRWPVARSTRLPKKANFHG